MSLTKARPDVLDISAVSVELATNSIANGIKHYIDTRESVATTTATTAPVGNSSTLIANTQFVTTALNLKANLANPTFTGTPDAPTAAPGTNTTQLATTAFVVAHGSTYAPKASPDFTGTITLPGIGACEIKAGTGDGATASTYNLTLRSWYGIGFRDHTDSPTVKAYIDCRTGAIYGATAASGTSNAQLATTAFVSSATTVKANLASPAFTGTPTAPTATANTNTTQLATTAFVQSALSLNGIDPGSIIYTGRSTAPTGFLAANGGQVSRATYAALYAAIGTRFGDGNGSTTFNLPDLRGEFIRGWDNGRGVDTGRTLGSWQSDAFKQHRHTYTWMIPEIPSDGVYAVPGGTSGLHRALHTDNTSYTGGTETRPRNVALLACIKY